MKYLTLNEEVLLLAIWKLKDNAYAVSVRDRVIEMTKRNVVYGTLYNSLDYLLKKRLVRSRKGEPTSERGGKRKIYYTLTDEGLAALKASREFHQTIWVDVTDIAFGGSGK